MPSHPTAGGRAGLVAALLLLVATSDAAAHAGSVGYWRLALERTVGRSQILVALEDVRHLVPDVADRPAPVPDTQLDALGDALLANFAVEVGGAATASRVVDARVLPSGLLEVQVEHALPDKAAAIVLRATLHEMTDDSHRVLARVERNGVVTPFVFTAAAPAQALRHVADAPNGGRRASRSATSTVRLGVEHILTGYDHLLFLGCLLLAGGTWRSRVGIISAFTAAHSVTLVLAAMRVVTLPARFVEAAIALSIAYVAIENLIAEPGRARWPAAFGFGLIHGFGFAGTLDPLDLPTGAWVAAVLAFNVGVELGQLAVMAVALPLLIVAARSSWHPRAVQYASSGALGLAVLWFFERLS